MQFFVFYVFRICFSYIFFVSVFRVELFRIAVRIDVGVFQLAVPMFSYFSFSYVIYLVRIAVVCIGVVHSFVLQLLHCSFPFMFFI